MLTITRLTPTRHAQFAALLTAVFALPAAAGAQLRDPVEITASRVVKANALSDKAASMYSTPAKYKYAATLHVRAASLRAPGDPRGYEDLNMAGHLYYAAGAIWNAREAMERAAEHAVARGDVVAAAKSYVDAGYLAIEERRTDRVPALALKAELLARSPLITDEQRASIMNRVGYSQVVAMLPRTTAPRSTTPR